MTRFIVRRILGAIPVLFGLSIILFCFILARPSGLFGTRARV